MSVEDYLYIKKKGVCHTDENKIVLQVTDGAEILVLSEDDLKDALANYGPLSIGIISCDRLKNYQGGLFQCRGTARHAVLLVGYDTVGGIPFWIIKNSWDTILGEQAYLRLEIGKSL